MRRLFALALVVVVCGSCGGSSLDAHAQAACNLVKNMDAGSDGGEFSAALDELKVIGDAEKSSIPGIREAAATKSAASSLSHDDPLYENPGDVEFNAVAAWCRQHS